MRPRALFGALLCATISVVVSGCPGTLDDPQRFQGAGLVSCDARIDELFTKTCAASGCHSGDQPAQGLDLASPGVADRLIGVAPTGAGCSGVLADPKNPSQSLLYLKLTELPPCGVPMPFGGARLSSRDLECMRAWIAGLGGDGGDGGAGDAATPPEASIADHSMPPPPPPDVVVPPDTGVVRDTGVVTARDAMPPPMGTGLKGEYFDEVDYTSLKLTRTDATIDFIWQATESPDPAIATDGIYSVRWTGDVVPEFGETYTFYAESDDGVRLTVGGQELFNDQTGHATTEFSGSKTLEAGTRYPVVLEWFNSMGIGEIRLSWSSASRARQVIPKERMIPAP